MNVEEWYPDEFHRIRSAPPVIVPDEERTPTTYHQASQQEAHRTLTIDPEPRPVTRKALHHTSNEHLNLCNHDCTCCVVMSWRRRTLQQHVDLSTEHAARSLPSQVHGSRRPYHRPVRHERRCLYDCPYERERSLQNSATARAATGSVPPFMLLMLKLRPSTNLEYQGHSSSLTSISSYRIGSHAADSLTSKSPRGDHA